ncbi:hypothetical protein OLMES_3660 [Oleiphilus messinensis]|uniref:Acireductone dioxygenase n=1 Tax=Oleiphilus messinensis TaxID=141451 RepID=A0A1Y0IAZ2_9GAMM|nr:cupin [Oleiphilus messinensis]ARU57687.1 hypothetical protein OLMES_3660 [Oleiphilus messinensis]
MTVLRIYNENDPVNPVTVTEDSAEIATLLNEKGVRFEHWPTRTLEAGASQDEILEAYAGEVERLKGECGFTTADVVSLSPAHPDKDAFRQKFLSEHRHVEDEVRFFVGGQGLFYLHMEDKVYVVLCQQNDLISVPDGTTHWFDMGPEPSFTCIRLFSNPEGWVADFTGSDIATRFPAFEDLVQ